MLANMSASDACRQEVTKCGGIPVLLRFLQVRPFEIAQFVRFSIIVSGHTGPASAEAVEARGRGPDHRHGKGSTKVCHRPVEV